MKLLKKRNYEYTNTNGNLTSTNYITYSDVYNFHGSSFAKQWLEFLKIGNLNTSFFGQTEGYYYSDYEFYARRTQMYLEDS